jgi:hypothetical protein
MASTIQRPDISKPTLLDLTDLRGQLQQELDTAKTTATLYISWFTFFLTVNYVALGWFTSTMVAGNFNDPVPLYTMAGNFVVQLALGIAGTLLCRRWALGTESNTKTVLGKIKELTPSEAHVLTFRRGHFPAFMSHVYSLCAGAMVFLMITWCVMADHARLHGTNPHAKANQTTVVVSPNTERPK